MPLESPEEDPSLPVETETPETILIDRASEQIMQSAIEELPGLAERIAALPNLEMVGLMCIPPFVENAQEARPYFMRLRELRDDLAKRLGRALPVLSMGMSHDFEVAIEEGATEVRVGTAIFGERAAK